MMDQLAALHAIRSDVEAGDAARALARIDAFDASYAGSSLREEVMVLRVEALARAGREAEARSAASAFFRSFPTSPYGPRVRAVVHTP
jgi:outer membrane protein assembly factor BamD (BamD/ComL family)